MLCKLKRAILVTVSLIFLALKFPIMADAQTIEEKIQEKEQNIASIVKNQDSARSYLSDLDNQIVSLEKDYKGVLFEKNKTEKNLNELNGKISDLEEKIKLRGEQLKAQARETQVSKEEASLLYVLASSDSISDAVSKTIGVTTLVSANNEVMQKQISDKKKLKEMREDVTKSLNEIESKAKVLKEREFSLAEAKLNQKIRVNEISAELASEKDVKDKYIKQKEEAEKRKQEELKLLEERRKKEAEAAALYEAQEAQKRAVEASEKAKQSEISSTKEQKQSEEAATPNKSINSQETNTSEEKLTETSKTEITAPSETIETKPVKEKTNSSSETEISDDSKTQPSTSSEAQPSTSNNGNTNSTGWRAPVPNIFVTSPFGNRADPTGYSGNSHNGIDMGGTSSTPISASRSGRVVQAAFDGSAGNYIIIDHGDGYYSYYLHMSSLIASVGQSVNSGDTIGIMGTTGNSTGVHLEFGVATTPNWSGYVNPAPLLGI